LRWYRHKSQGDTYRVGIDRIQGAVEACDLDRLAGSVLDLADNVISPGIVRKCLVPYFLKDRLVRKECPYKKGRREIEQSGGVYTDFGWARREGASDAALGNIRADC
jgi:hypothetical protein